MDSKAPATSDASVGQKVPDAHARDLNGNDVSLSSLYGASHLTMMIIIGRVEGRLRP